MLRKLQNLSTGKKQAIVAVALVLVLIIAVGTYGLWRTQVNTTPTNSIFPELANTFSDAKDEVLQSTGNITYQYAQEQKQLQEQERTFTEDLSENEFLLNREVSTNNVAVELRKILLDADKTIMWVKITNNSQDEIRFDPVSGIEATIQKSTYLATPLNNQQLQAAYELEGFQELNQPLVLTAEETVQGFVKLQTLPPKKEIDKITLLFTDFLDPTNTEKWDYTIEITQKDLKK